MGISGLLPFLEKASRPAKISEFSGCTVVVDTYCWLHKGAFSCAEKLARGEDTDQYVQYCMKYVNMLLSHNIKPILVFDGQHLPAKADTEKERRQRREANRKKAAELLRLDRGDEARRLIRACVDVTHLMALALMKRCRALNVDCIVAPYEADAQLAFFSINDIAHVVITEDSDLMLFGCKRVMFKMDLNGNGLLVEQEKLPITMKTHPDHFSMDKFRYMCILSGCDYLSSLPGIGLGKAFKFIKRTADDNISRALTRLGSHLNMPNLCVTPEYREKFLMADSMFKHQPVFDPLKRQVVPLTPLPEGVDNPVPTTLSPDTALQLALGNLDPFSLNQVDNWDPDQPQQNYKTSGWSAAGRAPHKSIWSSDYKKPKALPPRPDPREVARPTTKGKVIVQPVTQLIDQMQNYNQISGEEQLNNMRAMYGIRSPPKKKSCLEILSQEDEGVGSSQSEDLNKSQAENLSQSFLENVERSIIIGELDESCIGEADISMIESQTDEKDSQHGVNDGPTATTTMMGIFDEIDNLPSYEKEKVHINPFGKRPMPSVVSDSSQSNCISSINKVKKTVVEKDTIVMSRYFSSEPTTPPNRSPLEKKASKPSIFEKLNAKEEEDDKLPPVPSPFSPESPISASKANVSTTSYKDHSFLNNFKVNPEKRSFLGLIDSLSNVGKETKNNHSPASSFKYTKPLVEESKEPDLKSIVDDLLSPKSSKKISKPTQATTSPIVPKKKTPLAPARRVGLTKKRSSASSDPNQPSLLTMFSFKEKPKLVLN